MNYRLCVVFWKMGLYDDGKFLLGFVLYFGKWGCMMGNFLLGFVVIFWQKLGMMGNVFDEQFSTCFLWYMGKWI